MSIEKLLIIYLVVAGLRELLRQLKLLLRQRKRQVRWQLKLVFKRQSK